MSSVQRALEHFTLPERLDGANKYRCERCNRKVPAVKQFLVHQAPNVLVLQLKRFAFMGGMMGGKINKPVSFTERLSLTPFMKNKEVLDGSV
jgi:ubiquitin carboxyl-terminal hydrolase 36/42